MPLNIEKYLLTPGPLTTSKLTKEAMLRDVGSWDSDFKKITSEIREKLVNILMQTSNINKIKNSNWLENNENSFNDINNHFDLKLIILSGSETEPFGPSPLFILSTISIPFTTFPKTL